MVAQIPTEPTSQVIYPDCDGNPMSDRTKQFRWIVTIEENLELLFAEDPQVFVAGDLLWYPVEDTHNWISPRLGIRFNMQEDTLVIYRPDDRPFLSFVEIDQLRQQAQQETQQAQQETQQARQETQQARQETQQARQQAEKLAAKLRELGIDPNDL